MRSLRGILLAVSLSSGLISAAPVLAELAAVPDHIAYQGVLLNPSGSPRTGVVDITLRIYDDPLAGTLLYEQSFADVELTKGVFSVTLGPTGSASGSAGEPLTTHFADVFAADLEAGSERFLEISVNRETALARTQMLATAFSVRAGTADHAVTASRIESDLELDGANISGVSSLELVSGDTTRSVELSTTGSPFPGRSRFFFENGLRFTTSDLKSFSLSSMTDRSAAVPLSYLESSSSIGFPLLAQSGDTRGLIFPMADPDRAGNYDPADEASRSFLGCTGADFTWGAKRSTDWVCGFTYNSDALSNVPVNANEHTYHWTWESSYLNPTTGEIWVENNVDVCPKGGDCGVEGWRPFAFHWNTNTNTAEWAFWARPEDQRGLPSSRHALYLHETGRVSFGLDTGESARVSVLSDTDDVSSTKRGILSQIVPRMAAPSGDGSSWAYVGAHNIFDAVNVGPEGRMAAGIGTQSQAWLGGVADARTLNDFVAMDAGLFVRQGTQGWSLGQAKGLSLSFADYGGALHLPAVFMGYVASPTLSPGFSNNYWYGLYLADQHPDAACTDLPACSNTRAGNVATAALTIAPQNGTQTGQRAARRGNLELLGLGHARGHLTFGGQEGYHVWADDNAKVLRVTDKSRKGAPSADAAGNALVSASNHPNYGPALWGISNAAGGATHDSGDKVCAAQGMVCHVGVVDLDAANERVGCADSVPDGHTFLARCR